jgi:hypothetical protein
MGSWSRIIGFAVLLTVLVSCKSTTPNLKPEKEPEAYNVPPLDDKRYTEPIQYPDDVLNDDGSKKKKSDTGQSGMGPKGGMGGMH